MDLDVLLARPGLDPSIRLLAIGLTAVWRADWNQLRRCAEHGAASGQSRADFEEMLLQAVLFCGFPRVVSAFEEFEKAWPAPTPPSGGELPEAEQRAAGEQLFATVYGKNAPQVGQMLESYHADFHRFAIEVAYGRVLSRPGLSGRIRELLAIAALAASEQLRQYAGHARGAIHLGATRDEIREILITVFGAGEKAEDWFARIPATD